MKYLSICSGIEAASVAWHPLGWTPVAFAETEAFPRAVLAHHYPDVPNLGDVNRWKDWPHADFDVLVGGTPCQSFSVAGLRRGMADPRGNLTLVYLAIADRYRPEWLVWENVPGVLSSDGGRDFAAFIGGLEQLGYHAAWRVLDAQYVRVDGFARAVPQRRRRVFVVGHLGNWQRPAAVLFEREGMQGHPAPRRQAWERAAPTISVRPTGGGGLGTDFDCDGGLIPQVANPLTHRMGKGVNTTMDEGQTMVAHSLKTDGFDASEDGTGRGTPLVYSIMPQNSGKDYKAREVDVAQPVMAGGPVGGNQGGDYVCQPAVAFDMRNGAQDDVAMSLQSGGMGDERGLCPNAIPHTMSGWAVRRLTPLECERLQGFPDGYTAVPYRGKPAADGPRYKSLGNSMAVNVMRWIGRRIQHVDGIVRACNYRAE